MYPSWTNLHALWSSEKRLIGNLKHWGHEINGPSSYCRQDFNFDHFTPLFHRQGPRNVLKWKTHGRGVHSVQKSFSVIIKYVYLRRGQQKPYLPGHRCFTTHDSLWDHEPMQYLPPYFGVGAVQLLYRFRFPFPQVSLQEPHATQLDQPPCTVVK